MTNSFDEIHSDELAELFNYECEQDAANDEWYEMEREEINKELDRIADLMAGKREVHEELDNLADLMDAAIDF